MDTSYIRLHNHVYFIVAIQYVNTLHNYHECIMEYINLHNGKSSVLLHELLRQTSIGMCIIINSSSKENII